MGERRFSSTLVQSFGFAFRGLSEAYRRERNFRIQCAYALMMVGLILWLRPEPVQILIVVVAMGVLLAFELSNSAVERLVDLVSSVPHPLAGLAKDLAASAVLVVAVMTAVVNILVIGPLLDAAQGVAYYSLVLGLIAIRFRGDRGVL